MMNSGGRPWQRHGENSWGQRGFSTSTKGSIIFTLTAIGFASRRRRSTVTLRCLTSRRGYATLVNIALVSSCTRNATVNGEDSSNFSGRLGKQAGRAHRTYAQGGA